MVSDEFYTPAFDRWFVLGLAVATSFRGTNMCREGCWHAAESSASIAGDLYIYLAQEGEQCRLSRLRRQRMCHLVILWTPTCSSYQPLPADRARENLQH